MMQVIRTLHAILLRPSKTELATAANSTRKSNPN
jgi:hypothetical protein